jgi:hypothetical protein
MRKAIDELADSLPTSGLTVKALSILDRITPGQWENISGFDNIIRAVSGETDGEMVGQIRARALELWADESQGYQRALSIYETVDKVDAALGAAAMASKLGERISMLSFLNRITPNAEKAQALDLAMKLVAECVSFSAANGFPGDGVVDFVKALESYEKENLIRMSAIITFNGVLPLGPDYALKLMDTVRNLSLEEVEQNRYVQMAKGWLPGGGSAGAALEFVNRGMGAMESYVSGFANNHGITAGGVLDQMRGVIEFSEDKLDYLAAFLDMSTNYMTHTGTQSICRTLIERAVGEI